MGLYSNSQSFWILSVGTVIQLPRINLYSTTRNVQNALRVQFRKANLRNFEDYVWFIELVCNGIVTGKTLNLECGEKKQDREAYLWHK